MRLILVRHALPERAQIADGRADPPLTELGRRQAARVAEALAGGALPGGALPGGPLPGGPLPGGALPGGAGERITAIRTSPMRRARETAAPLADALGLPVEVVPGLAEFDVDHSHYIPVHEMAQADPDTYARLRAGQLPAQVDVPAFRARVAAAVDELVASVEPLDTVACFAHAGVINVYLADVLGIDRPLAFPLDYTGITRVSVSRSGGTRVRTVNEISHVADLLDLARAG